MRKGEMVRWRNHGGSYLYEGQHVSIEKFVVVHQTGTRVILPDTHRLSIMSAETDHNL